jgi:hypothetical protein
MPKTWCAHYPAFVGRLRDGEIFIVGRRRDQHAALGAAGFCNCVVAWINLVHKLERLAGEHAYLRTEGTEQLNTVVGFSAKKRVPDDKRLRCSLLHGEDIIADLACLRLPSHNLWRRRKPGVQFRTDCHRLAMRPFIQFDLWHRAVRVHNPSAFSIPGSCQRKEITQ